MKNVVGYRRSYSYNIVLRLTRENGIVLTTIGNSGPTRAGTSDDDEDDKWVIMVGLIGGTSECQAVMAKWL